MINRCHVCGKKIRLMLNLCQSCRNKIGKVKRCYNCKFYLGIKIYCLKNIYSENCDICKYYKRKS